MQCVLPRGAILRLRTCPTTGTPRAIFLTNGEATQCRYGSTDSPSDKDLNLGTGDNPSFKITRNVSRGRTWLIDTDSLDNTLARHQRANATARDATDGGQSHIPSSKAPPGSKVRYKPSHRLRTESIARSFLARSGLSTTPAPRRDTSRDEAATRLRASFLEHYKLSTLDLSEATPHGQIAVLKRIRDHITNHVRQAQQGQIPPDILHYTGVAFSLPPATVSRKVEPWTEAPSSPALDGIARLDAETTAFGKSIALTPDEQRVRAHVVSQLQPLISTNMPDLTLEIFGTSATGLAGPTSDIDVRFVLPQGVSQRLIAEKLVALLQSEPIWTEIEDRSAAKAVISAVHTASGVEVQLVVAPGGKDATAYVRESLACWPNLQDAYAVLRAALGQRRALRLYDGSVGSYGLFNMLVACAKMRTVKDELPDELQGLLFVLDEGQDITAAILVRDFLKLYGNVDTEKWSLSALRGRVLRRNDEPVDQELLDSDKPVAVAHRRLAKHSPHAPWLLSLQDGASATNDLGKRAIGWKHVAATLKAMSEALETRLEPRERDESAGRVLRVPLLRTLMGRYDLAIAERRSKLEEFAMALGEAPVAEEPVTEAENKTDDKTEEQADIRTQ